MQAYYDTMRDEEEKSAMQAAKDAAKSAALWGTIGGISTQLLGGNRSIPSILLRGLGMGAASAPIAAGATALGQEALGQPNPEDPTGYTKRGALGGAVGGGLMGAGLGYLLGGGRLRGLAKMPMMQKAGRYAEKVLPIDNLITDYLKHYASSPSPEMAKKAATLLGLTGTAVGGLKGLYAGEEADELKNLQRSY